ncbi:MAG: PLP-dependent aminotransferase family protein, partial [Peptococcaceae bacterium]|nr:PLP-dependent aminotransferase family protein [Peptococcaceae bacterium]
MGSMFSDRISDVPRSFIREILKVAIDESVISFAGGLPNRDLFPVEQLRTATNKLFDTAGKDILQYSESEGYLGLREWIAARYKDKKGIVVDPKNILITTGSQQGLDLLGKTFLNEGDSVILEKPGYLGAIQAFSVYKSRFFQIPVDADGIDLGLLEKIVQNQTAKLFYTVPNFQNPSGITYSEQNRRRIAEILHQREIILIEDDPYGELRFLGTDQPSFYSYMPENTILLGSFSKIIVPSFRIGWIVANDAVMEKLLVAKQASDLHTNYFCQRIIHQYLADNDIDEHIELIRQAYGKQREA